ncbi:Wzy polymerase domain-containing protein [Acidovorax sp. D2M1]|uniref:Wzy polymerase domain-containing protein n=1 Tax=Acidovorax benzenivorans TaxID=2987520 RepID=A0ABT5RWE0_9BURK|nr:Wzy polymerase domain-containing protein [Acidovorax benzenivorans]MDD2178016.1 Wzy polymerase domain-containing protein [Acidovorax benzenivorans]
MSFAAIATPLTLLALALPFLFCFTQAPVNNFWPLLASWSCGAVLVLLALGRSGGPHVRGPRGDIRAPQPLVSGRVLATGLVLTALVAAVIGLLQYFLGDPGLPGVQPSTPGQAIGNLRQRNQQATLLGLGVWALLWTLAQVQGRLERPPYAVLQPGRMAWGVLIGLLMAWGLALLAISSAATASRTGAVQWLLLLGLMLCWRVSWGRLAVGLGVFGLVLYGVAAWLLPLWLLDTTGFASDGLFMRIINEEPGCTSRRVLWGNVLHLIAQKPWAGWGWGELDYAHYITVFPDERFCVLLDNAHNLPLHLAVELGVPLALALCGAVVIWVLREKPWREADPERQLAWGMLALVGLHSLLEFPLWYGPFQLVTVLAIALLWRWQLPSWATSLGARRVVAAVIVAALALGAYVGWDFYRVSQLYKPLADRPPSLRHDTVRKVGDTPFFTDQVDFALLTTMELSPSNAGQVFAVANKLLHFSPEPRVIEPLIESATMLGLDDEAAFHLKRYRAAYPADYERWREHGRRISSHLKP